MPGCPNSNSDSGSVLSLLATCLALFASPILRSFSCRGRPNPGSKQQGELSMRALKQCQPKSECGLATCLLSESQSYDVCLMI